MEELNYQAMFEAMSKRVLDMLKADEEYFKLVEAIGKKNGYITAASDNVFRFRKNDQLKLMRAVYNTAVVAEEICNKYHLFDEESEEEQEND